VKTFRITIMAIALGSGLLGPSIASGSDDQRALLQARETVWRAWFAGDTKTLQELLPADTIAISTGNQHWDTQPGIIQSAAKFRAQGGRLIRLEFYSTKIQRFGDVAMLYTRYLYEIEVKGKRSLTSGRVTEIFVFRNGKWINPGWHTDREG
jgi:hypothetical protein